MTRFGRANNQEPSPHLFATTGARKQPEVIDKRVVEALVNSVGDKIADLLDQLVKGNWVDELGHPVKNNIQMLNMKSALIELGEFRADHLGYTAFSNDLTGKMK